MKYILCEYRNTIFLVDMGGVLYGVCMEFEDWYELASKLALFSILLCFPLAVMILKALGEWFEEKELDNLMPMAGTFLLLLSLAFGSIIWLIEKNYPSMIVEFFVMKCVKM